MASSHDFQTPATLEMGTLATPVNENLVPNDMEVSSVPRSIKTRGAGELCYKLHEREATVPHIPYSELAVESTALAAGSFKSVYKARWEKKGRTVALLVLRHSNQAALSDMENEIRMFGTLGKHKHLAELLATCTQAQSQDKCMVMEFAPLGSLDHVLIKADEDGVDIGNLVKMTVCMQVAEAMTHLHLHNVLHRDLAIRNTLAFQFDPQNWKLVLVKVTDYGLSLLVDKGFTVGASVIEVATMSSNAAGPTRWMAPESIMRRVYSKPDPAGQSATDTVAPSWCKTWVDICFEHLCLQGLVDFVFLIRWCRVSREWMDALKRAVRLMQQVSFPGGRAEAGARRRSTRGSEQDAYSDSDEEEFDDEEASEHDGEDDGVAHSSSATPQNGGVTGEEALRALGLVVGGNVRFLRLRQCRNLIPGDIEEILHRLQATCLAVMEVDVTGCRDDVVLRALSVRTISVFGGSPLDVRAQLMGLAQGSAHCPLPAFLNALELLSSTCFRPKVCP